MPPEAQTQRRVAGFTAAARDLEWMRRWLRAVGSHHPRPTSNVMARVNAKRWRAFRRRLSWRISQLPMRLHPRSRYFQRTSAYRSEWLALWLWGVGWLTSVSALVGFAALVGLSAKNVHTAAVVESIARTITQPAIAVPIAFVLLTAAAGCCRGARLATLAWRPGPIVVADFAMPREIPDTTPAQVTALVRDNLSLLALDSAGPSPGAPPETSFLDVLKAGGVSSGDILSSVLSVLQASWPAHALEVHGMIQERDDPLRCGITLNAMRLPNEPMAHVEIWASSWEQAARQAADGTVAALLPRTRVCLGPWASWQRFRLPAELFTAYREAAAFERDRRYDEALSRYGDALALDPTNLTIALQQGQLQEKIGLFLGALMTYQRILALESPGRQPMVRGVYARPARREQQRAVAVAKYRQIVLLGQESLLREWFGEFAGEPEGYRRSLRDSFRAALDPLTEPRGDPSADVISRAIRKLIKMEPDSGVMTAELARWEMMPDAYQAAFELQRSLSRVERRPWGLPVSRRTIGLTLACLRWRAELAIGQPKGVDLVKEFKSAARWAGASPAFWFGWRPALGRRWTWQQHYTAACLFAIPMARWFDIQEAARASGSRAGGPSPAGEPPAEAKKLARRAVDRLERAAARSSSEFVATRGDWVVEEDLELRGLRDLPEFKAFVAQYFPGRYDAAGDHAAAGVEPAEPPALGAAAGSDRRSPARVAQTDYARSLLTGVAAQWHEVWHQRAGRGTSVDPRTLKRWWSEEKEIWTLFAGVAKACLDWESRLRLLQRANELLEGNGIAPVVARYGSDAGDTRVAQTSAHAPPAANGARLTPTVELLADIEAYVLQRLRPPAEAQFEHRLGLLRRVDAEALYLVTRGQHRRICLLQAAVWQTLGEWLSGALPDGQLASKSVLDSLAATAALWARAEFQLDVHVQVRRATSGLMAQVARVRRGRTHT
jgi:hypothetical protein